MSLIEPLPVKLLRLAKTHWRKIAIGVFLLLFVIFAVVAFRSCGKKQIQIDEEGLQKVNSINRAERLEELTKRVEANAESVATADNTMTIADTNVIERNAKIAEKVKAVDKEIEAAKQQGRDITQEELECLLTGC